MYRWQLTDKRDEKKMQEKKEEGKDSGVWP